MKFEPSRNPYPGTAQTALSEPAIDAERVRLLGDGILNYSATLVSAVVGLALVPSMLRGFGTECYGLWIAVFAVADVAGSLDFGLGLCVTREVALCSRDIPPIGTIKFIQSARCLYILGGAAGAVALAVLGGPLSRILHLSPHGRNMLPTLFALAGAAFFCNRVGAVSIAILTGLRRFDVMNAISIASTVCNGILLWLLLRSAYSISAVALWRVALLAITAGALSGAVLCLSPNFGRWVARFDHRAVISRMHFVLVSQVNSMVGKILVEAVAPIIGFVLGPSAIIAYEIGQKFPRSVSTFNWRVAEVFYPVSSEKRHDSQSLREVLDLGTRWTLIWSLPVLIVLWVTGPILLHVWVPSSPPEALVILKIAIVTVFIDSAAYTADNILWGVGEAGIILKFTLAAGATGLIVGIPLLFRIGVVGIAIGVTAGFALGSSLLIWQAARYCDQAISGLLRHVLEELALPALATFVVVLALTRAIPGRWSGILAVAVLGAAVYFGSFYALGAREEDKRLVRTAIGAMLRIAKSPKRSIWSGASAVSAGRAERVSTRSRPSAETDNAAEASAAIGAHQRK